MFPESSDNPTDFVTGKEKTLSANDRKKVIGFYLLWVLAITPLLLQWFRTVGIGVAPLFFWVGTAYLAFHFVLYTLRVIVLFRARKPKPVPLNSEPRVAVLTTFVDGEAPLSTVEASLRSMAAIRYPHETYLLDESDRPDIRDLCARLGVKHFSRKNQASYNLKEGKFARGTRHGNYNAWLDAIGYRNFDFIAVFDLDHMPLPEFLDETLGYFHDSEIAYVQGPQVYYNTKESWVALAAAEKTYSYYSLGQMARFGNDSTILDGCHNVNRVQALSEIDGFQPHKADDLLTTLAYLAGGWKGVYVPQVLAEGQAPTNWKDYFIQQYQWAYTTLEVKFRYLPRLWRDLNRKQRFIALIHGGSYFAGVTWSVGMLLLAYLLVRGPDLPFLNLSLLLYFAPIVAVRLAYLLWQQKFFIRPKEERGLHWRNYLASYAVLPYYFAAFWRALWGGKSNFRIIPKSAHQRTPRGYFVPQSVTALILLVLLGYRLLSSSPTLGLIYLVVAHMVLVQLYPLASVLFERLSFWEGRSDRVT